MNLNKPTGLTSHDCVGQVRRLLSLKRVGHGGTLDPLATGVLPLALGPATRLLQFLPTGKAYRATIRLGMTTTTDDLAGEPIVAHSAVELSLESIHAALRQFQGTIQQIPPAYSAVQVQGQRLYDLARAGKPIEVKARTVEILKLDILDWRPGAPACGAFPELDLAIACGPGTYIRAIARDLGAILHVGGTLAALTRTQSGEFKLCESLTLAELQAQVQSGRFSPISPEAALAHLRAIALPAELAQRWCWGQKISLSSNSVNLYPVDSLEKSEPSQPLRVHHEDGHFLGIAQQVKSGSAPMLIPQVVLAPS